ncbi:MAG: C4-type zinc ribbon domain-containing protein [Phycisphaerae bacterium]
MGVVVEALHRLQEVELQLAELKQRIAAKAQAARAQERRIETLTRDLETKRRAIRDRQIESDRLSLDIRSSEERIAKLRTALNTSKTNKEYASVLTQLNTDKADVGKIEEKAIGILNEIDVARKALTDEETKLGVEQARLADLRRLAGEYEAQVADRLARLTSEREQAAAGVPPTVMKVFTRVAEKHDGQAMAEVTRTNPRKEEFVCGGCNMSVTLQQVNEIISKDDPIMCKTCGRILYLERATAGRSG